MPPGHALGPTSDAIARVKRSAVRGELVVVIGSGVSMSLTNRTVPALSWKGLIEDGFAYALNKGRINPAQA